jgi:peptidyl-prolyl cis-trans isomerase C
MKTFRCKHILLEELEDAEEIYDLLLCGEDFDKLAHEYSSCDSSKKGGDLGSFSKGSFVPEFEVAFLKLDIGAYSRPVKTKYGYHIIYRIR